MDNEEEIKLELNAIEASLRLMGADRGYCLEYFKKSGGCCEQVVNGQCIRHRCSQTPLPEGQMCSTEFSRAATMLRQQIERIEEERRACRREWDRLKSQEQARTCQFLNRNRDLTCRFPTGSSIGGEEIPAQEPDAPSFPGSAIATRREAASTGILHAGRRQGFSWNDRDPPATEDRAAGAAEAGRLFGQPCRPAVTTGEDEPLAPTGR